MTNNPAKYSYTYSYNTCFITSHDAAKIHPNPAPHTTHPTTPHNTSENNTPHTHTHTQKKKKNKKKQKKKKKIKK